MSDIVAEIRSHLQTMAPHQRARLTAEQLKQAADEIERLRLTEEEREMVERALSLAGQGERRPEKVAVIRGLLGRFRP